MPFTVEAGMLITIVDAIAGGDILNGCDKLSELDWENSGE
jgi:hypothetical protein